MRVPRVAILASKLAPSVGIDRPLERHTVRVAPVQDRLHGQHKIFRLFGGLAVCFRGRGGCCEAGDADQPRVSAFRERRSIISDRTLLTALGSAHGPGRRGAIRRRLIRSDAALVGNRGKASNRFHWAYGIRALGKESYSGW